MATRLDDDRRNMPGDSEALRDRCENRRIDRIGNVGLCMNIVVCKLPQECTQHSHHKSCDHTDRHIRYDVRRGGQRRFNRLLHSSQRQHVRSIGGNLLVELLGHLVKNQRGVFGVRISDRDI